MKKVLLVLALCFSAMIVVAQETVNKADIIDLAVYKTLDAGMGTDIFLAEVDVTLVGINTSVGYMFAGGESTKQISLGLGKSIDVGTLTLTPSIYGATLINTGGGDYIYGLDGELDVKVFNWLAATGKYQWTQNNSQPFALDNFGANYLVGVKVTL